VEGKGLYSCFVIWLFWVDCCMGSDVVVGDWEKLACVDLFVRGKSVEEVTEKLNGCGYVVSVDDVRGLRKSGEKLLASSAEGQAIGGLVLTEVGRVEGEFEDLYSSTKLLLKRYQDNFGESMNDRNVFTQLVIIKEVHAQLKTALERLGEIKAASKVTNNTQVNVFGQQDVVDGFRKLQDNQFDLFDAELIDGKIVFNKPSPEFVDALRRRKAIRSGVVRVQSN